MIVRIVIWIVVLLVGATFALQGGGVLMDSPVMSGKPVWLYIGIALVVVGLAGLIWTALTRRRA